MSPLFPQKNSYYLPSAWQQFSRFCHYGALRSSFCHLFVQLFLTFQMHRGKIVYGMVYAAPICFLGFSAFHNNRRFAGVGFVPHAVYFALDFIHPNAVSAGFYAQFHMGS